MKERILKAVVEISITMEENETEEDAADRLYDLLFDCLCRVTPTDFTIIQTREVES